jgi:hypothetical protein
MIIKSYIWLSKKNIIHRDIRPSTIFFRANFNININETVNYLIL